MNAVTGIQHAPEGFYADLVKPFAEEMVKQLRANEHKGSFQQWRPSYTEWRDEMKRLMLLAESAVLTDDQEAARRVMADIGNVALAGWHIQR